VSDEQSNTLGDTKSCPACAEEIKAKAKVCRYCGYEFGSVGDRATPARQTLHRATSSSPPPPPPPSRAGPPEQERSDQRKGLAIASLVLGAVGCTFFFAPAIQYQWAFVFGAAALITGAISGQAGGKTLAGWGVALGILALLAGYLGYRQVQEAVGDFDREMEQIEEDFQRDMEELENLP
jgi:hypothetical protein